MGPDTLAQKAHDRIDGLSQVLLVLAASIASNTPEINETIISGLRAFLRDARAGNQATGSIREMQAFLDLFETFEGPDLKKGQ